MTFGDLAPILPSTISNSAEFHEVLCKKEFQNIENEQKQNFTSYFAKKNFKTLKMNKQLN